MTVVTVQELIDAGVHFGHQARRWNPKMKPFIHGRRHNVHLIDLKATIRGLFQAQHFVRRLAGTGGQVLFVGTKKQIRSVVEAEAKRAGMPAITERWIGGTLTNFATVRERLTRLNELEGMEADGSMERHKKKAQSMLRREMRKIQRNLEGVRELYGMPSAMVVIDPRREDNAMKEAARMNVPVIALLDTDCDPDLADIAVPGNDDAVASVQLLLGRICDALLEGRAGADDAEVHEAKRIAAEDPRTREVSGRRGTSGPGSGGGGRGGPGGPGRGGPGRGGPGRGGPGRGGPGRGGPGGPGGGRSEPGGRLGRQASGRFADRAAGHSTSISIGGAEAPEVLPVERPAGSPVSESAPTPTPTPTPTPAPAPETPPAPTEPPAGGDGSPASD